MKKIISIFLAVALSLLLFSCGEENISFDKEEVCGAAKALIKESGDLNEIYWGKGIGYTDEYRNGYYYSADAAELERFGIESVDDLKEKTVKVFSASYSAIIFSTVLSSYGDDDGIVGYSRYYQEKDRVMVYSRFVPFLTDEIEYLYDTVEATHSKKNTVYVSIDAKVTRGEKTAIQELSVGLVFEEGAWKIDTPTYVSYKEP